MKIFLAMTRPDGVKVGETSGVDMQATSCVHVTVMHPNPLVAVGLESVFGRDRAFKVQSINRRIAGAGEATWPTAAPSGGLSVVVADYQTALDLSKLAIIAEPLEVRPRILVVANANRSWQVRNALQSGVHGYVSSDCEIAELLLATRRVALGERYLCTAASRCVADSLCHQELTRRELEVLALVSEGLDNKTISRHLSIALGTVKSHVRTLLGKLSASSRTAAVAAGVRRGLIGDEIVSF